MSFGDRLVVECGQIWRDSFGRYYAVRYVEVAYNRARVLQEDNTPRTLPLEDFISGKLALVEPDPRDLMG